MNQTESDRLSAALDGWANRYASLQERLTAAEDIALIMANKLEAIRDLTETAWRLDAKDIEAILDA